MMKALNQSNLGARVTSRQISWLDLCTRAWSTEFYAPDHKIYQWSSGRNHDSTDLTDSGIYNGGADK